MLAAVVAAVGRPLNEGRLDDASLEAEAFKDASFSNARTELGLISGAMTYCFILARLDLVEHIVAETFKGIGNVKVVKGAVSKGPAIVVWRFDSDEHQFSFCEGFGDGSFESTYIVVSRWLAVLFLCEAYASRKLRSGAVYINLGDEGHAPGLCFCDFRPEFTLIPDCNFLETFGYIKAAADFKDAAQCWDQRESVAFWRGSSTGAYGVGRAQIPRVKLCEMAISCDRPDLFDCGITQVVQTENPLDDTMILDSLGVLKRHVPLYMFSNYKIQIDIDGNTNSWPGMFGKLQSGAAVVKVTSPRGFRQWYYDRLIPWVNFVPAKSDLSDIIDIVKYLAVNDRLTEDIGCRGLELAASMTFEHEIESALERVEGAISAHAFRSR